MTKDTIISLLQSKQSKDYLQSCFVDHVWLVGSYARGDYKTNSDIDILVEFGSGIDELGMNFFGMSTEVASFLGKKVDILDRGHLNKHIAPYILHDKIPIW